LPQEIFVFVFQFWDLDLFLVELEKSTSMQCKISLKLQREKFDSYFCSLTLIRITLIQHIWAACRLSDSACVSGVLSTLDKHSDLTIFFLKSQIK